MRLADFMFDRLADGAGSLVGVDEQGKLSIFPMRIREKAPWPCITFQRIDANRTYVYEPFEETTPWADVRVQVNCWAFTFNQAEEMGEAVLLALSGYADEEFTVIAINELDTYEPQPQKFRRILDFRVSHEEILAAS